MHGKLQLYGSVTVGTKGQVVIPADARHDLKINTGDKLVVFGLKDRNMLGVCSVESVEGMLIEMTEKLKTMRDMTDKIKGGK